jgi:CHAD domain-containing protein
VTELLLPPELSLEAVGEVLTQRLSVRDGRVRAVRRRFYDTFDGRLYAAGVTLVHADGGLALVERLTGAVKARAEAPGVGRSLFADELAPGPLREALLDLAGVRVLLPQAAVRCRERSFDVLDSEAKTVVRLTLEVPEGLRPRLRLGGVRGYDSSLAAVGETLRGDLRFQPADEPLVDEAIRAAGGVPAGVSAKIEVGLEFSERSDRAAAAVLRRLLEVVQVNLGGAIAGTDTEFLHDLRVAVRRTRSVLRELRSVFDPDALERFRAEFRWLQQVTGDARDLDVYVLEFEAFRALVPDLMRGDLEPLLSVLVARRATARRRMARALHSPRTVSLLSEWSLFLDQLGDGGVVGGGASRPIGELAGERIRSVYRRMRRMGAAIDTASPAAEYHDLRKKGKELRYLLELFGAPLYPPEVVRPMIRTLKALQDVLGRHQDREVQQAMIYSLVPEVSDRPRTLMALGALVQRLGEDELAARAAFAERFEVFASKSQRALVRETFAP